MSEAGQATFTGTTVINTFLELKTYDDQANKWVLFTDTNDALSFNYNGAGDAEIFVGTSGKLNIAQSDQGIQIGPDVAAYTIRRDSSGLLNFDSTQSTFNGYIFDTADGERFKIDSTGNKIMNPASTASQISAGTHSGSFFAPAGQYESCRATSSTSTHVTFRNTNGSVGTIKTSSSSTSYNTSSDYRLKENVVTDWDATTRLKQLKPSRFNFKADKDTTFDGFLAHEAQEVVPEAVSGTKDGMITEEYEITPAVEATYDDEGNELTPPVKAVMGEREVPDYQGIDQSKLVPLLTKALQEAVAKIETLEAKVTALEGQ